MHTRLCAHCAAFGEARVLPYALVAFTLRDISSTIQISSVAFDAFCRTVDCTESNTKYECDCDVAYRRVFTFRGERKPYVIDKYDMC